MSIEFALSPLEAKILLYALEVEEKGYVVENLEGVSNGGRILIVEFFWMMPQIEWKISIAAAT